MVLVRMGEDQPVEVRALLLDEAQVGQHDVHTRQAVVGEADAEIDHRPPAGEAIQVAIDADLADPTERHETQIRE